MRFVCAMRSCVSRCSSPKNRTCEFPRIRLKQPEVTSLDWLCDRSMC